jgi:hypothetical protein
MTDFAREADGDLVRTEGGRPSDCWAWSRAGCVATGDSLEEVECEVRDAITFHLEGLAEDGEPLPEPSGLGVYAERKPPADA